MDPAKHNKCYWLGSIEDSDAAVLSFGAEKERSRYKMFPGENSERPAWSEPGRAGQAALREQIKCSARVKTDL